MDTPIDLLQVKIDKAMEALPRATRKAIDAVDWKSIILGMRDKKGFSFEQLEDLNLETELVLSGLAKPEEYPTRLEEALGIPRSQVDLLVSEMNEFVFKRIREELIKNSDREAIFVRKEEGIGDMKSPVVESMPKAAPEVVVPPKMVPPISVPLKPTPPLEHPEIVVSPVVEDINKKTISEAIANKLSGEYKSTVVKTEYSLNNLSKNTGSANPMPVKENPIISKSDPYRIDPNE